ncbi:MAG: Hsp20/alpha crystallin family protein [Opitutales bacterium]
MKNQIIPQSWRDSIDELREEIGNTVDRWLSRLKPEERREAETRLDHRLPSFLWNPIDNDPRVNVEEDEDKIRVTAELPGLRKEDLHVEVDDRTLTLSGEKETRHQEKRGRVHLSECSFGSFTRVIPLPCEVNRDGAKAKYRHGVLKLTLPKTETAKARRIEVAYDD